MKRIWLNDNKHWFDHDNAFPFHEDRIWDGSNLISVNTLDSFCRQILYLTCHSWVLATIGYGQEDYEKVSDAEAVAWLARNGFDESEIAIPSRCRVLIEEHLANTEV